MEKGISKIRERCYQKVIFIMNGSTKIAIHASIFAIFLITVTKYLRKKGGNFLWFTISVYPSRGKMLC